MRICIIFTGGTIASRVKDGYLSPDSAGCRLLPQKYSEKYGIDFEYVVKEPFTELSENSTGLTIGLLIKAVDEALNGGFDGIIVTHGTDTLQYSAAALRLSFAGSGVPICLVSANFPLDDSRSNGLDNFRCAVKFCERGKGGVWVTYKNPNDDHTTVHNGAYLLPSQPFSDEFFSMKGMFYEVFDSEENFHSGNNYKDPDIEKIMPVNLNERCESVMKMSVYPGMLFPEIPESVKYLILESYHSGTLNTKSVYMKNFFGKMQDRNIKVLLSGTSNGISYESTAVFEKLGIIPVPNVSPILLYMALWFKESLN